MSWHLRVQQLFVLFVEIVKGKNDEGSKKRLFKVKGNLLVPTGTPLQIFLCLIYLYLWIADRDFMSSPMTLFRRLGSIAGDWRWRWQHFYHQLWPENISFSRYFSIIFHWALSFVFKLQYVCGSMLWIRQWGYGRTVYFTSYAVVSSLTLQVVKRQKKPIWMMLMSGTC